MTLRQLPLVRVVVRDLDTIRAALSPAGGGWRGAWRSADEFLRRRSIIVATPAGAKPVLRTQVLLKGDVQSKLDRERLYALPPDEARRLVALHFEAVASALACWPAALALLRAASWAIGTAAGAFSMREAWVEGRAGLAALLSDWRIWAGVSAFVLAPLLRILLRFWLRRRLR